MIQVVAFHQSLGICLYCAGVFCCSFSVYMRDPSMLEFRLRVEVISF